MANLKFWDFFGGTSPKRWHLVVVLDAKSKDDFARYFKMNGEDYHLDQDVRGSNLKAFLLEERRVKGCLLNDSEICEDGDMDDIDDRLFVEKLPDIRTKTISAVTQDKLGDLTIRQWLEANKIDEIGAFSRIERSGLLPPKLGVLWPVGKAYWGKDAYDYIMDTKLEDLKATGDLDISGVK